MPNDVSVLFCRKILSVAPGLSYIDITFFFEKKSFIEKHFYIDKTQLQRIVQWSYRYDSVFPEKVTFIEKRDYFRKNLVFR